MSKDFFFKLTKKKKNSEAPVRYKIWGVKLCKSLPLCSTVKREHFYYHGTDSWHGKYRSAQKRKEKTQMIIISVVALKVHCRAEMGSQKARMTDSGEMVRDPARDGAPRM